MKYLKLFGQEWLDGSIRVDLDSSGRGVWADLLAMAQISRRVGYIERSEGIPYTNEELAQRFKIPLDLLMAVIAICMNEGRLGRLKDGTYYITNWNTYQDIEFGSKMDDALAIKKAKGKPYSRPQGGKQRITEDTPLKRCPTPKCGYVLEDSKATKNMNLCPACLKKGKEVELVKVVRDDN